MIYFEVYRFLYAMPAVLVCLSRKGDIPCKLHEAVLLAFVLSMNMNTSKISMTRKQIFYT